MPRRRSSSSGTSYRFVVWAAPGSILFSGYARGFQVVNEFVDRGVSGAPESRLQLNQLVMDARQREAMFGHASQLLELASC